MGREKEKKILVPNSVHTQPRQENSEKNTKKIQKIKKPLFGIVSSQNRFNRLRKKKILVPNSVHTRPGQENSEKNRKKRIIKLKNHFTALYLFKTGGGRPRKRGKHFSPELRS